MANPNMSKTVLMEIPPMEAGYGRRREERIPDEVAADPSSRRVSAVENAELKILFDNLYDAALIADLSGNIVDANPRASHACQYGVQEFRAMNIARIILGVDGAVMKMICDNLTNDQFTLIQASCRRRDGTEFPGEISSSRIHLSSGDYLCFFIRDVSARREAEEQIQKANEDLNAEIRVRKGVEERLRDAIVKLQDHDLAKSQFVSNVSHELKTPLASINHMVGNLMKGIAGPVEPRAMDYLAMMRTDCERLARTVEDILDMSRLEANALQLNRTRIPFPRFVRRAVESLRIQIEAAGLTLAVDTGSCAAFVDGDARKLERVIFNVVRNAVKYNTPQGFISVRLRPDPASAGFIRLEVVDSGIGIEPRYLKRVTERFFRVGEHVSGAGLGLAISKDLLEHHGGSIELQSPPEGAARGTQVTMRLPVVPPPRVRVWADDAEVGGQASRFLAEAGYDVSSALLAAAGEAIEPVAAGVVCWTLPALETAVAVRALQAGLAGAGSALLVVAEHHKSPVKEELLRGMGVPTLTLPLQADALVGRLEQVSGGSR